MNVFVSDEQDDPVDSAEIMRLARLVLRAEGLPDGSEMAIVLVAPEQIAQYNERFMQRHGPTNVLAFPLEELQPGVVPQPIANGPPMNLGDVFVCPAVVREGAAADGVGFERELALAIVHGILHLFGYHHHDDASAGRMEGREREILGMAARRGR
ncbi:MAG: rRNA maturation RNase YbeY [Acidimicrobiia bacterium]